MDSDDALSVLELAHASSSSERLRSARYLAQNATGVHRERLSAIRANERNSWVRQALDHALERAGRERDSGVLAAVAEPTSELSMHDSRLEEELRAQATEETAKLFLHELRPLVGLVDAAAADEVENYKDSKTRTSIGRVRSFLEAIANLRTASAAPAIQEFDLTDMVVQIVEGEVTRGRARLHDSTENAENNVVLDGGLAGLQPGTVVQVALGRRDPVVTVGDPALVGLALANALRNAVEAVLALPEENRADVIINWGVTDTDSWIVVLDEGCGLPAGWDRLTELGVSTKSTALDHFGMGLPTARRAIESMSGTLRLAPRSVAGASCEMRWPRGGVAE